MGAVRQTRNLLAGAFSTAAFTIVLSMLLTVPLRADERMMKDTDLRGSDFRHLITRNEFTCLQACAANERCRAWTFVARGSKCFLKNAVPAPAYCSYCVSGVVRVEEAAPAPPPPPPPLPADQKMMENTNLPGSDFGNIVTGNDSSCMGACSINEECRAWTFVKNGSQCFLKNAVPAPVSDPCCVSGVKAAGAAPPPPPPPDATPPPPPAPPALMTCKIQKPLGVCPTANACGEGTGVEAIGELEAIGTVTILSVQGPWHEVVISGGRHGFVFSGEGYQALECK